MKTDKRQSPDALHLVLKNVATLGFIGYLRIAPGTWGTGAGLLFVALLKPSSSETALLLVVFACVGTYASHVTEIMLHQRDSKHIVIDEFTGYLITVAFLPLTPVVLITGFLLFRFFDILKPPPVNYMERIAGGLGIMLDDVMAGLYSNLILHLALKVLA